MQVQNRLVARYVVLFVVAGMAAAATLSNTDKQFLIMAAKADMTEAHEGEMAQNLAARADVKTFAQELVQNHKASYTKLGQLAGKTGFAIPVGIDASKDRTIEQLARLKGDRFDRQFTRDEIAAQQRAISSFEREAKQGQNADVKAYATEMIPILKKDLAHAERCSKPAGRS